MVIGMELFLIVFLSVSMGLFLSVRMEVFLILYLSLSMG